MVHVVDHHIIQGYEREYFLLLSLSRLNPFAAYRSSLVLRMIEGALDVALHAALIRAGPRPVVERMKLLLLPPMRPPASALKLAALFVAPNKCTRLPARAQLLLVICEKLGLPSEILPVVCVYALGLVVFLAEGTPLGLKVEHVEVIVLLELVYHSGLELSMTVRERAVVSILALLDVLWVLGTISSFILFNVVEPLNSVVSQTAGVALGAAIIFQMLAEI